MVISEMEIRLRADIARLQRDMDSARQVVGNATAGMERAANAAKGAIASIASGLGIQQFAQMIDQYQKYSAQLKLATSTEREYAAARSDVQRIARVAQQDLGATGVLYAKIANGTRELGVTQAQVAAITETVNMALKVSGATASESASAQLQLSQAFASGTLRGEEFNAVNEAAPRLMLALADGIGVPVGALKKMAEEGRITSEIMADVLPKALVKVREEAREIQTIGGAMTVLKNSAMEFVGVQANASGVVSALTSSIEGLADNLAYVAASGAAVATVFAGRLAGSLASTTVEKVKGIAASIEQAKANELAAAAELRRAQAERQSALIAQSRAREATITVRAEVAADQQRMASSAAAAESAVLARQAQFVETANIVRAEIALEQTRHAAQINGIGRAARVAEMAALATQLAAIEKGMAASSAELTAVRIANENAASNAAAVGAAKIAAAREAEVIATGGAAAATLRMRLASAALTTAMGAASIAAGVFRGALALLGGPVGAVITLLSLGAIGWTMWGNKAQEGNDKALKSTEETGAEMIARLDKQIEKLRERNKLAETEPRLKGINELSDADRDGLARAKAALDANRATQKGTADDHARMLLQLDEINLISTYETQLKRVGEVQEEVARAAKNTRDTDLKEWYGKNGTAAQKMAAEMDELRKKFGTIPPEMEKLIQAKYADKGAAQNIKQEETAYTNLITSIRERMAANELELSGYDKLSQSQQMTIKLDAAIGTGKNKLSTEHIKEGRALIGKVEAQEQAIEAQQRAAKWAETEAKNDSDHYDRLRASTAAIGDQINKVEREIETYGLAESAAIEMEKAKLEAKLALGPATYAELIALDEQIAKMGKLASLAKNKEALDANKKAADEMAEEQKRLWGDIERTAHDTFISIFDSGKSAFDRLKDALKNGLYELLYQMTMKKWIMNISGNVAGSGGGVSSIAQAAAGGGGFGNIASMASNAYGAVTGGMTLAGGLGTGFMGSLAGGLQGAGIGSGLASSSGLALGNGIVGVIGEGTASALGTGLSTLAAAAPYLAAVMAAYVVWKKLDTSGTYHAGGAASATSAGVTAVSAGSLNMERIQSNAATQSMVAQLAQGVVGILDSTALAFGKTAGYQAATAFADDTSKDGAWGSLVISKLGQSIVNWQDTRGNGKWSQKTFADGEKGQEQYLAALTSSVRIALDSIGLPDWARTMLNGVASDASLDDLAKVVDQVNQAQAALGAMRSQLAGFANLSDTAVSALMAASGGIEKLFSSASAYYDAFYTEAEKNSTVNGQIAKQLAAVNLAMPATRDGFRALVEAQMSLGTQGAESVSVLLGVAGAFAQMHPEVEAATKDLAAQRSAVTEAYNAEADALKATTGRLGSFATSLRDLNKSALLGNLSPLSPQQKYAEAKAQYEGVLAAARGGDEGAQSNYRDAFTSFLEASRTVFASSTQYQTDFAYAQAATEEAARWAEAQVDVGQAQLDMLKSQVSGIIEINQSVLSVRDALLQYSEAMNKNTAPLTAVAPPVNTPIPYGSYGTSNTEPLVAEIKSLNAKIEAQTQVIQQQTVQLTMAAHNSASDNADQVSEAVRVAKPIYNRVAVE